MDDVQQENAFTNVNMQPQKSNVNYGQEKRSCCNKLKNSNNGDEGESNKGFLVATTLVNLFLYLLYVTIVCITTFGPTAAETFYLTKTMNYLFIDAPFKGHGGRITTFRTSSIMNDFWTFSETVLLPDLYSQILDPGHTHTHIKYSRSGIEWENKLIGKPIIRQIQVVENECLAVKWIPSVSKKCHLRYSKSDEEKRKLSVDQGGTYQSEKQLHSKPHNGWIDHYSGAGYVVSLPDNIEDARSLLHDLKQKLWIKLASRAVFLEFTFFNPNIDVFAFVRLVWEIPATGGVTTSWKIETVKIREYGTAYERFILACEIFFVLFTIYYFVEEIVLCFVMGGRNFFASVWTYISAFIFIMSWLCIGLSIMRYFTLKGIKADLASKKDKSIDIHYLVDREHIYHEFASVLIFLVWLKLLKYFSFSRSVTILAATIKKCAIEIGGFALIFVIILFAFAQFGYVVFGNQVPGFRTFGLSLFTLWRFILGNFNYYEIYEANRFLGPIFFFAYVIFVFMILVNMFLAIINESYHLVHCSMDRENKTIKFQDCADLFPCCNKNNTNKITTFEYKKDIRIEPKEIRQDLRLNNFSDFEIEMFMDRFNISEHDKMDGDEAEKLLTDIIYNRYTAKDQLVEQMRGRRVNLNTLTDKALTDEEKAKEMEKAEIDLLVNRLGVIESAVVELVPKIETFLGRLELKIKNNENLVQSWNNPPKRKLLRTTFQS